MTGWTDNVVLTRAASEALRREFIGWQCRLRQLAAREHGGRPSSGMRPRVIAEDGGEISPDIVTLIIESEPEKSTELFRYQYLKTQDPNERCDKMVEILQGSYFQEPARFSDLMTALFGPRSTLAALLCREGRCILDFEQYSQGYRIPCKRRAARRGSPVPSGDLLAQPAVQSQSSRRRGDSLVPAGLASLGALSHRPRGAALTRRAAAALRTCDRPC